ncbi:MAG TPA: GNAT family N-acetyltransferase [Dongiaceae bacterium]|nr:GNAT family N-acetyltransferase [Dongiaceae bacterium]
MAGVDLDRFLGIFASGPESLVDVRETGLLGVIMDRLRIADGAKPFEWIGAEVDAVDAAIFPAVLERLRATARRLGAPAVDITLGSHWSKVRGLLREAGAAPQFVDHDMTHADCAWGPDRALAAGWRWLPVTPEREQAYLELLNRAMGPMPGVYVPPDAEALASMRTTADGTKLLLDRDGRAQAMVRCKLERRYLHLICCAPEMRGRGLGRVALDEVRRMVGPGPLHLSVVRQNERAHGFYVHMGFVETETVQTWRLKIDERLGA